MNDLPYISIVVIGYNESENLENTFSGIISMNYPKDNYEVIYVDSGSTDNSIEIARKYTGRIFVEDQFPSPGRNRNRGLSEAKYDIVHFVDGDVIIDPDYLVNIVGLFKDKNVQAIVGKLDEQNPDLFNRLSALSNVEIKEGYTKFTSTGATYLRDNLLSVNGYDERIRRGEEIELGDRFREANNKIWCTEQLMGSHNFGVSNLWQYIQKYKVNAISMVQCALIKGNGSFFRSAKKKFRNQLVRLAFLVLLCLLSINFNHYWALFYLFMFDSLWRQKTLIKKITPFNFNIILLEIIIGTFGHILGVYGFILEVFQYLISNRSRNFYQLKKMVLTAIL